MVATVPLVAAVAVAAAADNTAAVAVAVLAREAECVRPLVIPQARVCHPPRWAWNPLASVFRGEGNAVAMAATRAPPGIQVGVYATLGNDRCLHLRRETGDATGGKHKAEIRSENMEGVPKVAGTLIRNHQASWVDSRSRLLWSPIFNGVLIAFPGTR